MTDAIITFVRNPVLGKVKTRLAAEIGQEKALEIYTRLLQHTKNIISPLHCDKYLFTSEDQPDDFWKDFHLKPQHGSNLGERMQNAFTFLFDKGYQKVIIIGSDCLSLTSAIIGEAFTALDENDMVIGPATDGGYYLLGIKKMYSPFFLNKKWSTTSVLPDTLKDIEFLQLKHHTLVRLSDMDEKKDVPADWL